MAREPLLHTQILDGLPDDHPLAWTHVYCTLCPTLVHASNNENMDDWVETGLGPVCLACFAGLAKHDDLAPYALPDVA